MSIWDQQYIYSMFKTILLVVVLLVVVKGAYEPELMFTAQPQFINRLIANYSDTIITKINEYPIPNPPVVTQKVSGVKVTINLTDIKQKVDIHWTTNVIQAKDPHTLKINSKNLNITLDAHIEAKVSALKKQKGPLKITVQKLQADIQIQFQNPKCPKSIGFDIQIKDVFINADKVVIKIEGKGLDNLIIAQVQKLIKPRIPGLLQKAITTQINPLLSNLTCNRIEEQVQINDKYYLAIINTTEVPSFDDSLTYMQAPIDLTLKNMVTNQTNGEVDSDQIPGNAALAAGFDVSLAASSNLLNTVIWLVGDAQLLHINVNNTMLGDNPPISLNTTNLSILLPNLKTKEWVNKEVFLMVTPSTKFQHLLVRSGRIVTVLSLSVNFVVITQGNIHSVTNVTECLKSKICVPACNFNMTLPLSIPMKMNLQTIQGLLQTASFYDISIIDSLIKVNLDSFKSILNSIIGSMIPSLNSQLSGGMELPAIITNLTNKYKISKLNVQTMQDFLALGASIEM